MNNFILIIFIIGILSLLIGGYFIFFNDSNEKQINLLPSNVSINVNGNSYPIENKCNSELIKCTRQGCEQVC
jgi:hypothetical protein